MRFVIFVLSLLFAMPIFAQKKCDFATEVNDSIGSYKETKGYLMHEKIFGGKSTYLFFSLVNSDGTPFLKMQKIVKSSQFIEAICLDSQSKIYLQLQNGKVVTLIYGDQETCGNLIRVDAEKLSTRLLEANFMFLKGSIEDLKSSPISLVRIRYSTQTDDIVVKKELVSELMNQTFQPERYFMENIECVID